MKSKEEEEEEEEEDDGGEGQKGKRFIEKLRRRAVFVGHRSVFRRPSTPVHISFNPNKNPSSASSRKLAASLWEFYQYYDNDHLIHPPAATKMHRAPLGSAGPSNSRRLRHGHGKAAVADNNGIELTDHQPESAGSIRRQIGQMLMKHHHLTERNDHALQPVSPTSYDSSLEFRGRRRAGEPNNNIKTSTELLKVLNRIWILEEQHSANISLIKSLKTELAHSRARIKDLLRCKQADKRDMDDFVKQLAEEKLSKGTKEHDRLSSAVQSLEDERKLRKRSESLYRKLAQELSEVKSTLSNCVKEMERGTESKKILERLCDEFAKGIKSYEREIHGLKQKLDKNWKGWDEQDHMILCIAESWLDERIQSGNGSALEKLEFEIETFLKTNQNADSNEIARNRRTSLESVPFNAMSAPIWEVDREEEEDSGGSGSNCFELKKHGSDVAKPPRGDETEKPELIKVGVSERPQRRSQSPSSLQVKFEDQMAWAMSSNEKKKTRANEMEPETEKCGKETNNVVGEMIRTHRRLSSETREIDEASCSYPSRRRESPIRQWNTRTVTPDLGAPRGVKDNTLKTKLSEARTTSSRPRVRLFKD
ncbi:intracellular protein transport protein USO1-like protein [Arabidopsis thaliana]|jgi:hypothetical protein|uniref:Intracellular protein transport protein USO1-like protein n=2 Tax=Arabidopsis thaliana TaxID=3702 RepID=F4I5B1_ARATH|nr:intracellular protein transport protein USO1-like protein [Arabidopsis thaliana]AEE34205.1 intracellular protein transport protein USO1-like protein [Arabidopsis thaliana]|eukprot:NP_564826.1 intracellular protein transport protein USO1-like protein [Arabidopsis thaliana]